MAGRFGWDYNQPMDNPTAQRLLELNRQFYADHAAAFARSRGPGQAGVLRTLPFLPAAPRVLDLGCGNGRLARCLAGHRAPLTYVGIDASPQLLSIARQQTGDLAGVTAHLVAADLVAGSDHTAWTNALPGLTFDAVYMLAVLHHLPQFSQRAGVLRQAASVLAAEGVLIAAYWQFLDDPQQRSKIIPWSRAGIDPLQVTPGDALLSWSRDAPGLRYCHHVDAHEAADLAAAAGLRVVSSYYADGRSRRANLFQICQIGGSGDTVMVDHAAQFPDVTRR